MGLFSSIGRALTNVKRAACRGVGKVIEKVGEITGNIDIEMKGYEIQCNNPYLEKQVDLNSSSTSVQDTIDVHKMCEETRQQAASQARKYEDEIVDKIEEDINGFIDALSEVFPDNILAEFDYGIGDAFEDDIHNTVSDYVARHISQDSEEFVKILNMNDSIRAEKTDEYVKKVINEALNLLHNKCRNKKIAVYRKMCDDLEAYFTNEKNIAEKLEKNMKELQEHKNDMDYYENRAIDTVKDIAYMECIRTLTYGNV